MGIFLIQKLALLTFPFQNTMLAWKKQRKNHNEAKFLGL